jgi:hypothetical protein
MALPTVEPLTSPRPRADQEGPPALSPAAIWVARVMDEAFTIPGTDVKIGLDPIVGLLPAVGDLISTLSGAVLFSEARRLKLSSWQQSRMFGNYLLDLVLGAIPLVGDLFDVAFKANSRNVDILKRHVERLRAEHLRGRPAGG